MPDNRLSPFFPVITNYQRVFAVGTPGNPISRYQRAHVPVTRLACLCAVRHARINSLYRHKTLRGVSISRIDFKRIQVSPRVEERYETSVIALSEITKKCKRRLIVAESFAPSSRNIQFKLFGKEFKAF